MTKTEARSQIHAACLAISIRKVAKHAGIHFTHLHRWFNGERGLSAKKLARLRAALAALGRRPAAAVWGDAQSGSDSAA